MKKVAGIFALAFLLTACSSHSVNPGSNPYAKKESEAFIKYAQSLPPVTVPPGVPDPSGEAYYPVPQVSMKAPFGTKPPLTPPGSRL